jgi:hypothetical protein
MSKPLTTGYDHMHRDGFPLKMGIDELAEQIVAENYGYVRFQAALVRAMRKKQAVEQAYYDERGDHDIKATAPLVDIIEHNIRKGMYR